jgi:hypothetical protein
MEPKSLKEVTEKRIYLSASILKTQNQLTIYTKKFFEISMREQYIREIYQNAQTQFSRLRRELNNDLKEADIVELEKWIGRAKGDQGLINIIKALKALKKYQPHDIHSNLYALVQKIIIEGPYPSLKPT